MKKLLVSALFVLVMVGAAQSNVPKYAAGLDAPTFGVVNATEDGGVKSIFGANIGLGVSYRAYTDPLMPHDGSIYWEAGTIVLIDPYIGGGYDYRFTDEFYAGIGVDFFPLHLYLAGSGYYAPAIIPSIHVGVFF